MTTYTTQGTPTEAPVDLIVPSCQPPAEIWISNDDRSDRFGVLIDEHVNRGREALPLTLFCLIFAERPKPTVQSPFLLLERPGTSRNGLARLAKSQTNVCFFVTVLYDQRNEPQTNTPRYTVLAVFICIHYLLNLLRRYVLCQSDKASAPFTVKAPSTNSVPLLLWLGASPVGNLDDGEEILNTPTASGNPT